MLGQQIMSVMGEEKGGPIALSLAHHGYMGLLDLFIMSQDDLDALDYPDPASTADPRPLIALQRGKRGLLRAYICFVRHLQQEHTFENFVSISKDDFDLYRTTMYDPSCSLSPSPPAPAASTSATGRGSLVDDFRKSIKHDKSHYVALREDKQWDSWKRSTVATARSHGCEEIFDPSYMPITSTDKAIFDEKQKFMYSVFEDKLHTDMGKYYVRLHEHDYDAQAIFASLQAHAKASTQASIDTAVLLSYITTTKLHESKWRGTSHSFVLHWCDRVRTYEELVDPADHFTGNVKLIMLQNAVSGVPALHQVKTQSAHDIAHGGKALTFEQYKTLLLSAASAYDAGRGLSRSRPTRSINQADLTELPPVFEDDSFHDIDTDHGELSVHATNQHPSRPFRPSMSKDKWDSLSDAEKKHWDMLSPQAKATILGISKPPPPRTPRQLNLTDISAADYLTILAAHEQHVAASTFPVVDTATLSPDHPSASVDEVPAAPDVSTTDLLACATKQHASAHPSDLCHALGM